MEIGKECLHLLFLLNIMQACVDKGIIRCFEPVRAFAQSVLSFLQKSG